MSPGGQILEAEIQGLSHDGRGVTRVDGKVVFVDQALPQELVLFRRTGRRRAHETGKLIEVLRPSPDRVAPPCPHFGVCGGCALQHLSPEAQVAAKQDQLRDSLRRIAKVDALTYAEPITGPVWGYRRKARLGVRYVPKKGGVLVGFRERHKSFITPLANCEVLEPRIAGLLRGLAELIGELACRDRLPQIEAAAADEGVALVFRHLDDLSAADRERLARFASSNSAQVLLQPEGLDSVHPLHPASPPPLYYRLPTHEVTIVFEPTDFIQVNAIVNEKLVDAALGYLDPRPGDAILDLFCGLGNFTLPLARHAGEVLGLEWEQTMVVRARDNAERNRIGNAWFQRADLYADELAGPWLDRHYDKVLLDPPRTGAINLVKHLARLSPSRIVYISCNPATLARDAEVLVRKLGFSLATAGVVDMFPHTAHVESIAVFEGPPAGA